MHSQSAFPIVATAEMAVEESGLTMRDYFAAAALSLAAESKKAEDIALYAYAVADAMMAERIRNVPK